MGFPAHYYRRTRSGETRRPGFETELLAGNLAGDASYGRARPARPYDHMQRGDEKTAFWAGFEKRGAELQLAADPPKRD